MTVDATVRQLQPRRTLARSSSGARVVVASISLRTAIVISSIIGVLYFGVCVRGAPPRAYTHV